MAINLHPASNFSDEAFNFTQGGEGFAQAIYVDPLVTTPTIAYGYALIVKNGTAANGITQWAVRNTVLADFAASGVSLSQAQMTVLANIATLMSNGNDTQQA